MRRRAALPAAVAATVLAAAAVPPAVRYWRRAENGTWETAAACGRPARPPHTAASC